MLYARSDVWVSKGWRAIIDLDPTLWQELLKTNKIWFDGDSELSFAETIIRRRERQGPLPPNSLPLPHPFKILFKSRHLTRTR